MFVTDAGMVTVPSARVGQAYSFVMSRLYRTPSSEYTKCELSDMTRFMSYIAPAAMLPSISSSVSGSVSSETAVLTKGRFPMLRRPYGSETYASDVQLEKA